MTPAIAYLAIVNFAAFAAMGWDKAKAGRGERRISERALLILAAAGGALGAVVAQGTFRHKTRKQPFGARLWVIFSLQLLGLVLLLRWSPQT